MRKDTFITIASFSFPHEAHVARALLEAEDIPVFMPNEHTITMDWLYSNALGGVNLQVPASQAERAKSILDQDYSDLIEEEFELDKPQCPHCGGYDLKVFTQGKKSAFIEILLIGFPLIFYKHGLKCAECGEFIQS